VDLSLTFVEGLSTWGAFASEGGSTVGVPGGLGSLVERAFPASIDWEAGGLESAETGGLSEDILLIVEEYGLSGGSPRFLLL
jgi:hypothetical protein